MLDIGSIVGGRLRVDQVLGVGGMGIVVAATHLELGNRVAIKVLRDELAQNPTSVERFIREARAVVNLRTEHVCRVFDVGRLDNGAPYIVMELLAGADLARAIAQKPLPVITAVDYVMQACVALAEAHAAGIVHRDLKPANLFVTRRLDGGPLVKVLDFGIAKAADHMGAHLTHTTGMMGSPGYMSPEQLQSAHDVDIRTDIWSLGVTLHELLSAQKPFAAPTLTEMAIKVATDPAPRLAIDPALQAVIDRCLEKEPTRRYADSAALAAALARFGSSDGRRAATAAAQLTAVHAPPLSMPPPVASDAPTAASVVSSVPVPIAAPVATRRRSRVPLILGAIVLGGGTLGIVAAVNQRPSPAAAVPTDAGAIAIAPPVPVDARDAWATIDASDAPVDAGEDAGAEHAGDPPPPPNSGDIIVGPGDIGVQVIDGAGKEQMKQGCRISLGNKHVTGNPRWAVTVGMCRCVLDQIDKAQQVVNETKDVDVRNSIRSACAMFGIRLK